VSAPKSIFDADLKNVIIFCSTSSFGDICMCWLPDT